jgi:voltage-gated potassium channel Kch
MSKTTRFTLLIITFVICLLILGTVGYRAFEPHWSLSEAFYMTVITISTVGFGEIRPLSEEGRYFTSALIFLGLFAISIIGAHAARLLIDSEVKNVLGRKRMKKEITGLKDHTIVCGYGRIGSTICTELQEAEIDFVVIERNESCLERADALGYRVIKGDATSDSVLREAGIERAQGVVAALDSDSHNLFISLAAREIKPDIKIIARGEDPGIENRLLRAGADIVVSPLKLGGRQIANMIVDEHRPCPAAAKSPPHDLIIQQMHPEDDRTRTVEDLVQQAKALVAVAIHRADGRTEMMPPNHVVLEPEDTLFVCRGSEID